MSFFYGVLMPYENLSQAELIERLQECEAALTNMNGFFNTPVAHMKFPGGKGEEEARRSASDYLAKYDVLTPTKPLF